MKFHNRWVLVMLLIGGLQLAACKRVATSDEEEASPAKVEHLGGNEPARVTLTAEAARRIDITTAMVSDATIDGTAHKAIPYAAVLYDTNGDTWTYLNPEPLIFVRHHISVDRIVGDMALLADGPPAGAKVVTVGATELFGSETEFEEE